MRPIFTLHAGEYLVAEELQQRFPEIQLWVPCKDTGIDLLVSDGNNRHCVALQVKFSKDFAEEGVRNCGWWTIDASKLRQSKADYWVFVMYAPHHQIKDFVIIKPRELLRRLKVLHGGRRKIHVYFWIIERNRTDLNCWETRGLRKSQRIQIREHHLKNANRNFSHLLNNWKAIIRDLRIVRT